MERRLTTLRRVFSNLSEREARALYEALAQWADNERCGFEETDEPTQELYQRVALVEGVVERLEEHFAELAEAS